MALGPAIYLNPCFPTPLLEINRSAFAHFREERGGTGHPRKAHANPVPTVQTAVVSRSFRFPPIPPPCAPSMNPPPLAVRFAHLPRWPKQIARLQGTVLAAQFKTIMNIP